MKTNLLSKIKPKLFSTAVLVIAISSLAGGTLAYFTADSTAHNVITSGNVKITLQEWANDDKTEPFKDITGIMPGMEVTKIAEVKNTGDNTAWVRVKIEKSFDFDGADPNLIGVSINEDYWTLQDGWYYYTEKLAPEEVTKPIFTAVTFDETMGNAYQDKQATVDVYAQAVQTANNGDSWDKALGWPTETAE